MVLTMTVRSELIQIQKNVALKGKKKNIISKLLFMGHKNQESFCKVME